MLYFHNNAAILLFLFCVRTAQPYSDQVITNMVAFVSTVFDMPLGCAKLVCFVSSLYF